MQLTEQKLIISKKKKRPKKYTSREQKSYFAKSKKDPFASVNDIKNLNNFKL